MIQANHTALDLAISYVDTTGADPRFLALCAQLDASLEQQVGGAFQRAVYAPHNIMGPDTAVVLLENENGTPFGCGALRPLDSDTAELKRVFVQQQARCHGCGRALVQALMARARREGFTRMVLETGTQLKAAMHLYASMGFAVIPNYGPYIGMDTSVCMGISL